MSTFKNFVQCRVTTPITAAADSIGLFAVVPPYTLPSEEGGLLVLTDSPSKPSKLEVISYTSRSALGLYGVTRGLEGTTALEWTGPVYCYQSLLAGEFKTLLDSKVDKVTGKGLSDTNFTQVEKTKLAGVAIEATKNRADSENADKVHNHTVDQVTGLGDALDTKVGTSNISQTTGQSTTHLMSQSAITDAINAATENIDVSGPRPVKNHGIVSVSAAETVTCDVQESDFHIMSMATSNAIGTLTIDFSNMPDTLGKHFSWHVRLQRGARKTVAFAQTVNWAGGVAPTFSSEVAGQDLILFYKVDSETIRAMVIDAW